MVFRVILIVTVTVLLGSYAHAVDDDVEQFRRDRVRLRAEAYLEEGKKEIQRGSYFRGIRLLSQAIAKGVGAEAFRCRGEAYYLSGMYPEAISDITRSVQSSPSDPAGYVLLGDVYAAKGDYQAASKNFEKAISVDPVYVEAYVGRGIALLFLEKYGPAIKDFQVALQSEPTDTQLLTNMALACLAADMPRAGREFLEKALESETDPAAKQALEAMLPDFDRTSAFEHLVGDLTGYLAKASSSYEGTATISLAQAPTDAPDRRLRAAGVKRGVAPRLPVVANLQERAGRKISVRGSPTAPEVSGTWDGTYMGLRWNIDFKASGNTVSAILKIYSPSGKEDVHHCEGIIRPDGYLEASDSKGFRFAGRLTDDYRIVGTVTMGDGKSMNLDMPIE